MIARPGDTLILSVGAGISMAQADAIRSSLMSRLPDLYDVIIIPAVSIDIYRPEPEHAPETVEE